MDLMAWLTSIPPVVIYVVVGSIIGLESMGVPLPGEIILVSASVAASQGVVHPVLLAMIAACGAILGDSLGFALGRHFGRSLLEWLGRRAPRHFGPRPMAQAERAFARWGAWAVCGGRFVALLRILAGPLAGVLGMPYRKFLIANAAGSILWASVVTTVGYTFGVVAGHWLSRISYVALAVTLVGGTLITWYARRRSAKAAEVAADAMAEADSPR